MKCMKWLLVLALFAGLVLPVAADDTMTLGYWESPETHLNPPGEGATVVWLEPDDVLKGKILAAVLETVADMTPTGVNLGVHLYRVVERDLGQVEVLNLNTIDPGNSEIEGLKSERLYLGGKVGNLYFEVGEISFGTMLEEGTAIFADKLRGKISEVISTYIRSKVESDRKG